MGEGKKARQSGESRAAGFTGRATRGQVPCTSAPPGTPSSFAGRDGFTGRSRKSSRPIKTGKISISSPIARALIGKYAGDAVEAQTPGGVKRYEILDVRYE